MKIDIRIHSTLWKVAISVICTFLKFIKRQTVIRFFGHAIGIRLENGIKYDVLHRGKTRP